MQFKATTVSPGDIFKFWICEDPVCSGVPGRIDSGSFHRWCQPICIFHHQRIGRNPGSRLATGDAYWLRPVAENTTVKDTGWCSSCVFCVLPVQDFRQWAGCSWAKGEISKLITLFKKEDRCSLHCLGFNCSIWIISNSGGSALSCIFPCMMFYLMAVGNAAWSECIYHFIQH